MYIWFSVTFVAFGCAQSLNAAYSDERRANPFWFAVLGTSTCLSKDFPSTHFPVTCCCCCVLLYGWVDVTMDVLMDGCIMDVRMDTLMDVLMDGCTMDG